MRRKKVELGAFLKKQLNEKNHDDNSSQWLICGYTRLAVDLFVFGL